KRDAIASNVCDTLSVSGIDHVLSIFGLIRCAHGLRREGFKTSAAKRASGQVSCLRPCACKQLRRAGTYPPAVAPLALLAQQWSTTSSDTAGACRGRLLAFAAGRDPLLMPLSLSQPNRHANCK